MSHLERSTVDTACVAQQYCWACLAARVLADHRDAAAWTATPVATAGCRGTRKTSTPPTRTRRTRQRPAQELEDPPPDPLRPDPGHRARQRCAGPHPRQLSQVERAQCLQLVDQPHVVGTGLAVKSPARSTGDPVGPRTPHRRAPRDTGPQPRCAQPADVVAVVLSHKHDRQTLTQCALDATAYRPRVNAYCGLIDVPDLEVDPGRRVDRRPAGHRLRLPGHPNHPRRDRRSGLVGEYVQVV